MWGLLAVELVVVGPPGECIEKESSLDTGDAGRFGLVGSGLLVAGVVCLTGCSGDRGVCCGGGGGVAGKPYCCWWIGGEAPGGGK